MKSNNSSRDKEDDSLPHLHAGWSLSSEPLPLVNGNIPSEEIPVIPPAAPATSEATDLPAEAIAGSYVVAEEADNTENEPVESQPPQVAEDQEEKRERGMRAFWTIGSVLSILLNCILLVILVILGNQLFIIKKMVGLDLIGGLYANFVKMDQASIKTNITVSDQIPINFNLPISQDTVVTLLQPTTINGARVSLNTGGLAINNAPADIVLPAGTNLPVHLEMVVPVQQTVPINLNVPVDIPLNQTELHEPFTGLQQVISPFFWLLKPEWASCKDVPALGALGPVCNILFKEPK